jgi:hypothetical protein
MVYPDKIPNGFKIGALPDNGKRSQIMINVHKNRSIEQKCAISAKIS